MAEICEICGNEISADSITCPFCGKRRTPTTAAARPQRSLRVVNIELGRPTAEEALLKLSRELEKAKVQGLASITVIHGYGASGCGGKIRRECRKMLKYYQEKKVIRGFIPGEEFSKKRGLVRALLRRLPQLMANDNLGRQNKGVTIVEL